MRKGFGPPGEAGTTAEMVSEIRGLLPTFFIMPNATTPGLFCCCVVRPRGLFVDASGGRGMDTPVLWQDTTGSGDVRLCALACFGGGCFGVSAPEAPFVSGAGCGLPSD